MSNPYESPEEVLPPPETAEEIAEKKEHWLQYLIFAIGLPIIFAAGITASGDPAQWNPDFNPDHSSSLTSSVPNVLFILAFLISIFVGFCLTIFKPPIHQGLRVLATLLYPFCMCFFAALITQVISSIMRTIHS